MKRLLLGCVLGSAVAGCGSAPRAAPDVIDATLPAPPPLTAAMLPARTQLAVELQAALGTGNMRVGDTFTATVAEPIIAQNGETAVPAGAVLTGMVTGIHAPDADTEYAAIRLNFLRISINNVMHPLSADIAGTELAGEDAAATVLGAVITGDERQRLIERSLGIGAGTIVSLGVAGGPVELPHGTRLDIRTIDRLELRP